MFLLPDQQLARCDRVMQQRVEPHIHSTLAHCALRAADNPGEPEPSADFLARARAGQVEWRDFAVPGTWGTTWGTTWFEVTGRVDLAVAKGRRVELSVDLGWMAHRGPGFQSEGLFYRADGTAIKSANPRNSWIPLVAADGTPNVELDADGNFTVYVEAAANPFVEGPTPFSPTELGERADGNPSGYTLSRMDVCAFNEDMFDYYIDLETVSSLIRELNGDDPRHWQLAKALQRSLNVYDERKPQTVAAARGELAGVLAEHASSSAINHIAIGHAHIDSAWLWPVRETRRKVARTVSNVLALMDEDPDFTYAMSSAQQYAWLEDEHPDLFARMKRRIEEGRFIPVGGMWVESDNMVPAGESLIRQITFGRRYFKEHLGVEPRGIWLPDSFGYSGAWPQIARRAGFDWFLTQKISWNDTTKFPHHSFEWEGIDGTAILTHFPPSDTYCSSMSMHEVQYSQRNFLDKDLSRNAILLYGWGDGGGGPTREMTARVRRDRDLAGCPKVDFGTPDELFDRVRRDIVDDARGETPVFKGELYLELHRGTLTAQQDMKRGCRDEESMLRAAEYLCAAASLKNAGYVYPREELDSIWKTLLLNQFHDILPGSAIAWVHRQAREEYARDIERLRAIAQDAAQAIAAADPAAERVEHAVITPYAGDAEAAWTVREASSVMGHAGAQDVRVDHVGDSVILDNGLLRVTILPSGVVSSMVDLASARELVPAGTGIGRYELLRDEPFHWDAWDIQRDAFLCAAGMDDATVDGVERNADGSAVVKVTTKAEGVVIATSITLRPGAKSLDFAADVDWRAQERFLKVDVPVAVQALNAQYECQYGLVERPIQKNTRSDEAKFESCTHRFVRVADASYAAAVVNASTYGSDVSELHAERGTMIRLSLLSAPLYPDPRTDQGLHSFAWSVVANADMPAVLADATRLTTPDVGAVPAFGPLVRLEKVQGVPVLDWIKTADDGSGDIIARVYEAAGGVAKASFAMCDELADAIVREVAVTETDALDDGLPRAFDADGVRPAQGAAISLAPFQLATLRFSRRPIDGVEPVGNK
ncbi:alpha-mannosidase [Bifidobacterium eulemuris]|uniref:Alpha-mannosidase n=1 Tax=Bifidobacterium eulemuris TaxID=1765219 RepID=A0A261G9G8_9BIFI|nr:alpha-mannosidase [Bifidobacterium eulemuris]OZG68069.1 alpha-mannosidase [Bifidobacterium eulemuris]QOL31857.1 alpha-mannosidase [Bifidobacterium eulemuris]